MSVKNVLYGFIILFTAFLYLSCSSKPVPDKLPESTLSALKLLNENPQFVMYFNFQNMRKTKFWKDNIYDTLISSERLFGSILNNFQNVTGATISEGLDEFYLSNSWDGENAMVLKGAFDKSKIDNFVSKDTNYIKTEKPGGIRLYYNKSLNIYFFFKDNFTICASNFSVQIEDMINAKDTSQTGLMKNDELMKAIQKINYKNDLWLVSTQKMFIRGVFLNFIESKNKTSDTASLFQNDTLGTSPPDTANKKLNKLDNAFINRIHESINSMSLSARMKDELELLVQCECVDAKSSDYVYKVLSGLVSLARLNSSLNKKDNSTETEKILESMKINRYETSVQVTFNINSGNIAAFRKNSALTKPN